MANINKIRLSGTTYNIQDPNAQPLLTAGRGIDITNDTISVSLPISAGTGTNSIIEGNYTYASGDYSHAEGRFSQANGNYSHAEGFYTSATSYSSHAEGYRTIANNQSEHVSGQFNVSSKASNFFGESGNTLFSVGNGESESARHNAFEIRQNGDIYITSGGTDIKLQDNLGGSSITTVELTQAQYDALVSGGTVDPNTFYIITDATGGDLSNYYTKSETSGATEISTALASKADTATTYTKTEVDNAITAATSTKQDTLVSGTNIKTINNESILGSGNINIQGGGVNVVQTTGTSTTDVMSQDAVTTKLKTKLDNVRVDPKTPTSNYTQLNLYLQKEGGGTQSLFTYVKTINGKSITSQNNNNLEGFSLIETSAITTSISSSSTDSQVPSAKAVYDQLGGMKIVKLTESEYTALVTKDSNTLYVVVPDPSN